MVFNERSDGGDGAEGVLRGVAPGASVDVDDPCGFGGGCGFGGVVWEPDVQGLKACWVGSVGDGGEVFEAWNGRVTGVGHGGEMDVGVWWVVLCGLFCGMRKKPKIGV